MNKNTPYSREATLEEWIFARKKPPSESLVLAVNMKKGEVLMISHPDMFCDGHQCSLGSALRRIKEGKWKFRHSGPGKALVYREK